VRGEIAIGQEAELQWQVGAEHVIHLGAQHGPAIGSPGIVVFSTPNMILLMERAARKLLEPFLERGEESVGTSVNILHLAGTPIGAQVRAVAKVTSVEGKQIEFEVSAYDAVEQIGSGTHRRAVVSIDRITSRIAAKSPLVNQGNLLPMQMPKETGPLPSLVTLSVELAGEIATVRMNRPQKKNAVNQQMTQDWETLTSWFAGHPEVRVIIVAGNGDAFCAGDDVPEVGTLPLDQATQLSYRQARLYLSWEQLPQIMIAAVHGSSLGAGCVLACACDFRIAAHNAQFGMPEILLGWPPGYGIAQLTALVGKSRAMEMCITGEPISARQACDCGLVNKIVAQNELHAAVKTFAEQLLRLPKEALSETKRLVHLDEGVQPKHAYMADTAAYIRCLELPNAKEGIEAFKQKRNAKFR
jgi:enoyl-CoA hydratase